MKQPTREDIRCSIRLRPLTGFKVRAASDVIEVALFLGRFFDSRRCPISGGWLKRSPVVARAKR